MISLVIPLFNKEDYILRAINSALNQTVKFKEIIIVDDGSTDKSRIIVEANITLENKITLLNNSGKGVSDARNTGILYCKTMYCAFLDADDFLESAFVEYATKNILSKPKLSLLGIGYSYIIGEAKSSPISRITTPKSLLPIKNYFQLVRKYGLIFTCSSVVFKTDFLKEIGLFPSGIQIGEDQIVWINSIINGDCYYLNEMLSNYDLNISNSSCSTKNKAAISEHVFYMEKNMHAWNLSLSEKHSAQRLIAKEYCKVRFWLLKNGQADTDWPITTIKLGVNFEAMSYFLLSFLKRFPRFISKRLAGLVYNYFSNSGKNI